jgi:subfamily B ATP-binding cassette protein MsbA
VARWWRVYRYLRVFRWPLLGVLTTTTLLTVLGLVPPLLIKAVVDHVIGRNQWGILKVLLAVAIGVALGTAVIGYLSNWVIAYVGHRFVFRIRNALYQAILRHSVRFFEDYGAGRILSRLMEDTAAVQRMVTANSVQLVNDVASFLFCVAMLIYLRWELGLAVLGMVPVYLANHHYFVRRIRRKHREMMDYREKVVGEMEERISGTRLVKAFSMEDAESERLKGRMAGIVQLATEGALLNSAFTSIATSITSLGNAVLYSLGCYFVLTEWMTYGEVVAFMAYLTRLLQSALQITTVTEQMQETMVSVDRIFELMDLPVEVVSKPGAQDLPRVSGHVRFENVTFGYVAGNPVVQEFDLDVPAGTTVALVGASGCGKTTITSLLLRFYDVQQGRIRIDGHDIAEVSLHSLRSQMGQVLQQPFLFDGTIRENILYGSPEAGSAAMVEAARIANIREWVESLPDGYDTPLGEDGLRPSLGQKQQIAIARAVLTDPAILVLDEATSSLDAESEQQIQKALDNVLRNRTSFVVAHRLSTIRKAGLIVVMDRGRIVETGTHESLMARPAGVYRAFYIRQSERMLSALPEILTGGQPEAGVERMAPRDADTEPDVVGPGDSGPPSQGDDRSPKTRPEDAT